MAAAEFAMIIAIAGMILGGVIAITAMYFHHQRQKLWHETTRVALEKGQPIPPQPVDYKHDPAATEQEMRQHDLRGGLVLIAVGAGLFLFLKLVTAPSNGGVAALGLIPGFIGVALLVHYTITALMRAKKADSKPPQP